MGITTTLESMGNKFAEWHKDTRAANMHTAIYDEINTLQTLINSNNNNVSTNQNNIVIALNKIINGTTNTYTLNNIPATPNLISLSTSVNTINQFLNKNAISESTLTDYIAAEIENINTANNNAEAQKQEIINDFLVQNDINTQNDTLNNYKYTGVYRCINTGIVATLSNKPTSLNYPFILIVTSAYETNNDTRSNKNYYVRQVLLTIGSEEMYSRYYYGATNTWSSWSELYGTHNTVPVNMRVDFSDNSSQTYTLLTKQV